MMARNTTIMALTAGIVLGGAATEGFSVYRESQASEIFQQRVRCKAVADAFVKENTDPRDDRVMRTSVTLDKVDYSPTRNSCVAEVEIDSGALAFETVHDLLSGETLFSLPCSKDCLLDFQKREFVDPAFDFVMTNAGEPVELEKRYAQMESELAPKTTAPASSVAEPNDWQTLPATEYDAQGKPLPASKHPTPGFIPDTPASQQKTYYDPTTGERIQIDPATGEDILASKSPPKSAPPSLAARFIESLATVIVVMPVLWLCGKLRKRERDTPTSDGQEKKN